MTHYYPGHNPAASHHQQQPPAPPRVEPPLGRSNGLMYIEPRFKEPLIERLQQAKPFQPNTYERLLSKTNISFATLVVIDILEELGCDTIRHVTYGKKLPIGQRAEPPLPAPPRAEPPPPAPAVEIPSYYSGPWDTEKGDEGRSALGYLVDWLTMENNMDQYAKGGMSLDACRQVQQFLLSKGCKSRSDGGVKTKQHRSKASSLVNALADKYINATGQGVKDDDVDFHDLVKGEFEYFWPLYDAMGRKASANPSAYTTPLHPPPPTSVSA
ncbi:hypothetical protein B9479_002170 [Cryptococcus floricola]|uniref:Uncharacterized protein n=1 Tax=Cryptococcus floricola TaxID=2591691 RepID=A0A5D3B3B2_9TREE|nr:hypothetical protein B9479_002170 [Cryptococcus floricola]